MNNEKFSKLTLPSDANVEATITSYVEGKQWKSLIFTPTSDTRVLLRFSGHALRWIWSMDGTTERTPTKRVKMRGWEKKIYTFNGATIVLNKTTFELWKKSRPYKTIKKMVYANWDKVDLIAREFSQFAQIALKPIETEHPANISTAHLVMTTKKLNPILQPLSEIKDDVGLVFDESHKNFPELMGKKSVEGAYGAEWFFTKFPQEHQLVMKAMLGFEEYNRNIQLHLKVLNEMSETLKQIKEAKK